MATHELRMDYAVRLAGQPDRGHNRWHPDVTPVLRVAPGDEVVMDLRDAVDGQLGPDSTAEDLLRLDIGPVHPLTGPVAVEGAEPGDVLVVDVLDAVPGTFGYTSQRPGLGFLRDEFPDPFLVRWELADGWARSEDLPGVRIPAAPFPGTFGLAPSRALFDEMAARERELLARGGEVSPPEPAGAVPPDGPVAVEGLRTFPPRENAGNVDIRQCGVGARLHLPVWVEGACFSAGDAHFAQGDGESCGTAIEMRGTFRFRFDLRSGAARAQGLRRLRFERRDDVAASPFADPRRFIATTGLCVTADGVNHSEDVTLATADALRGMIDLLVAEHRFTRQQAYAICSVAVDLRIAALPNAPNMLVTAVLPLDVLEG